MTTDATLRAWGRYVAALPTMFPWIRHGVALERCASTQDECERLTRELAAGHPGVVVTAMHQTAARGRLGRVWEQGGDAGLAVTIGLDAARYSAALLSLAGGIAACQAVRTWVVGSAAETVGIKWPNDVVARSPATGDFVKLGGVLAEVKGGSGGLALLGIGINVGHREESFPPELAGRAASIEMLSSSSETVSRLDVLGTLLTELDRLLAAAPEAVAERWKRHDVLVGTQQTFETGGKRMHGLVRRIEPATEIVVEADGRLHNLPAATTTLVKVER
ncbi:MAG: hypothetical protein HEQ23_04930 [Tepidisphaera sp.]